MEQLKRLRTERGLTQVKLAVRADIDPSTLNQIEGGRREPSPATLRKLAEALDVSIAELLGDAPKGKRRSPFEPSFNDVLAEERREDIYTPWLEAVNRYADRWERRIASGNLNLEIVNEFISTLEDFVPTLSRLGLQEKAEQPEGYVYSFGPITGEALARIDRLMDSLIQAGAEMFSNSELEQLRQRRDAAKQARERVA